jgi:Ni,Fe-hydrogenase III large subunit
VPACTWHRGDVFARAFVRWLEVNRSVAFIEEQARALPAGPIFGKPGPMRGDRTTVALVEGWRGEICHVAITDANARFSRYKIVDPSFHNWFASFG